MIWYGSPYLAHAQATRDMSKLTGKQTKINGFWKTLDNGKRIFVNGYNSVRYFANKASKAVGLSQRKSYSDAKMAYDKEASGLKSEIERMGKLGLNASNNSVYREYSARLSKLANNLSIARNSYANTPLGKVENWVRGAGRNVMSWLRGAGKTIGSGLSAAKNWAVGAGKNVFNAVKNWVKKAFTKTRTVSFKSPQAQLADSAASEYNAWVESNKKPKTRRSNNNNPNSFVPGSDSDLIRNGVFRKK